MAPDRPVRLGYTVTPLLPHHLKERKKEEERREKERRKIYMYVSAIAIAHSAQRIAHNNTAYSTHDNTVFKGRFFCLLLLLPLLLSSSHLGVLQKFADEV